MLHRRAPRGFTLTEMLVATGVMVVLGLAVIAILRDTTGIWRDHEAMRDAWDRASAVMRSLEADLVNVSTDPSRDPLWLPGALVNGGGGSRPPLARLLITRDVLGRPVIVFTRQLKDEMASPITREAARAGTPMTPRHLTPWSGFAGLRAMGNLEEVAWCFGPAPRYRYRTPDGFEVAGEPIAAEGMANVPVDDPARFAGGALVTSGALLPLAAFGTAADPAASPSYLGYGLYRGSVSPPPTPYLDPRGGGSLFADHDAGGQRRIASAIGASNGNVAGWHQLFAPSWTMKYQLVSDGVLYVGFQVEQYDQAAQRVRWMPPEFDVTDPDTPPWTWDTADRYNPVGGNPGGTFPVAIRVTVTVEATAGKPSRSTLSRPLRPGDTELYLAQSFALPSAEGSHPFVLVGSGPTDQRNGSTPLEWIWFERSSGGRLSGLHRGTRGTLQNQQEFPAGTPVRWGLTIQKVVHLPVVATRPAAPTPANMPPGIGANGWSYSESAQRRNQYRPTRFPRPPRNYMPSEN